MVRIIDSPQEMETLQNNKNAKYSGIIKWGLKNLGVGLLLAMHHRKILEIDESNDETENYFHGDSDLLLSEQERYYFNYNSKLCLCF